MHFKVQEKGSERIKHSLNSSGLVQNIFPGLISGLSILQAINRMLLVSCFISVHIFLLYVCFVTFNRSIICIEVKFSDC